MKFCENTVIKEIIYVTIFCSLSIIRCAYNNLRKYNDCVYAIFVATTSSVIPHYYSVVELCSYGVAALRYTFVVVHMK